MNFFGKKATLGSSTIADAKEIDGFLSRGLENVFPSKEKLAEILKSGKKISIYLGIDPTGPSLHMGHAIPLMKLSQLQKMGHRVILLIGDFTAMIGDPDKQSVRKQLSREEVLNNCRLYKKQASVFLSFSGRNKAELQYNSTWLSKMDFSDVVKLASNMTVQQMIERDMFARRISEKKPIYLHEFLYPLMQGYDSVAMGVDAEIGGNDQTFNMLAGRDLLKSLKNKDKFVIATKLLIDSGGVKMGKTEGNMITLADGAAEMFGKIMSWPDGMIIAGFELCTKVSDEDIEKERAFLSGGGNPRDAKLRLAEAVASLYHGEKSAQVARESFLSAFSGGGMPADVVEVKASSGSLLVDILLEQKIVSSKTDWRRLVSEGAVKDLKSGSQITAFDHRASDMDLKVGKHRFIKIRLK